MRRMLSGISAMAAIAILTPCSPASAAGTEAGAAATEREFTPLDEIDRVRAEACGRDDFELFLDWYTNATEGGGWLEQVIWTDYMVKVGKLADPAAPANWIDRQDYLGQFRITSRDYHFSRKGAVVDPDIPYRNVTLTRLGDTQYRVDWRGGLPFAGVEGADRDAPAGAYIFEYKKDCWYLTGDLR